MFFTLNGILTSLVLCHDLSLFHEILQLSLAKVVKGASLHRHDLIQRDA